jgi:hypothetical protein
MQDLFSQTPYQNSILFSTADCFLVYGNPSLLSGNHTPLNMEWYYSENTA